MRVQSIALCLRSARSFAIVALFMSTRAMADGAVVHPYLVSANDPTALTAPDVKVEGTGTEVTRNRVMGQSSDLAHKAGLYSTGAERAEIDSYPVDEFMYFLKGGVTLTSADGVVLKVKPGDAVHVPKGWKGVWDSAGYTKFYVIYDTSKLLKK